MKLTVVDMIIAHSVISPNYTPIFLSLSFVSKQIKQAGLEECIPDKKIKGNTFVAELAEILT